MFKSKRIVSLVSLVLTLSICTYGQGNVFTKIRYQGGSLESKVSAKDWDNTLTVTSETITLKLKDGKVYEIDPTEVSGLSYGQEAHRRVGTMIALAVFLTPLALFGLFNKKRSHFVGIEWTKEDGKSGGVLLQADKSNYGGVLMALRGVTQAKISVAEADRKYVPAGIDTVVVKEAETEKGKDSKVAPAPEKSKEATEKPDSEQDTDSK